MAVTSEQLLAFVGECVTTTVNLDSEGNVSHVVNPSLGGDALAKAIEHIGNLAAHEEGLAFAKEQHAAREMGNVVPFPGPRAN